VPQGGVVPGDVSQTAATVKMPGGAVDPNAPTVKAAGGGEEKCQPGYTRNKAGACVPFGTPGINETLMRWHKLAGIIKG